MGDEVRGIGKERERCEETRKERKREKRED
jgi:hypothetical protein